MPSAPSMPYTLKTLDLLNSLSIHQKYELLSLPHLGGREVIRVRLPLNMPVCLCFCFISRLEHFKYFMLHVIWARSYMLYAIFYVSYMWCMIHMLYDNRAAVFPILGAGRSWEIGCPSYIFKFIHQGIIVYELYTYIYTHINHMFIC